jgi:hypothetical protein
MPVARTVAPIACVLAVLLVPAGAAAGPDPVLEALGRAELGARIAPEQAAIWHADYRRAYVVLGRLAKVKGVRYREMKASLSIVRGIAIRGALAPDVMPMAFLTLRRNAQWWSASGPPAPGSPGEKGAQGRHCKPLRLKKKKRKKAHAARLTFPGSEVVFQWYPGLGLQIQVNGTFAAAHTLFGQHTAQARDRALALLDEMLTLVSHRGVALTWDYLFPFGGASAPWASGLSQATAIRAYLKGGRKDVALGLAALYDIPAPAGIRVGLGKDGNWYSLYSFAPGMRVLNAHLNALIALYDLEKATGDPDVARLEREGMRAARRRIGGFDLGVWSRYEQGGPPADLNYHVLNRDLARALCERTGEEAICKASDSFTRELEARCPKAASSAAVSATPPGRSAPSSRLPSRTS